MMVGQFLIAMGGQYYAPFIFDQIIQFLREKSLCPKSRHS